MIPAINQFADAFNAHQKYDKISVRYTKEKNGEIIHKEAKIYTKDGSYYVKNLKLNETTHTKERKGEIEEITNDSLQGQHLYLTTLFSALNQPDRPKLSAWRSFRESDAKVKWMVRNCFLDTKLVGGVVGKIIAYSANKENPHYKTKSSQFLAKTLGPLIFPAGSKKPNGEERGLILIDSILYKQYKAQKNYNSSYTRVVNDGEKKIDFTSKRVEMHIDDQPVNLDTITASNELVAQDDLDHLHIIYFNGNSGCYQQDYKLVAEDLLAYAEADIPVTAVQFNYPGVLNSEGQVEIAQHLIDAGIAQVQALLDAGVPHHRIFLHGISLGASIASHVGAEFNDRPKEDNPDERQTLGGVGAYRAFASTAQVGRNFFNRALGDNILSRAVSTFCLPWIKLGTWASEWDLDTGKAFFSLPEDKRDYSVVLSPKANRKAYRKEQKRTVAERIGDFVLRREKNLADDAILRRGLHDSWERRWDSFRVKFRGKEARKAHSEAKHRRKMVVVDLTTGKLATDIDGHAVASYCYKHHGEEGGQHVWFNPHKQKATFGLVHRNAATIFNENHENLDDVLVENFDEHEASFVTRQSILRMVIPTIENVVV